MSWTGVFQPLRIFVQFFVDQLRTVLLDSFNSTELLWKINPENNNGFMFVLGEEKGSVETLNCLLARQLCFEDPSCSPILETIPRVCGPESGKEFFKIISIYYHRFT